MPIDRGATMSLLLQPLTLVTFFPLVGVLILLFLKEEWKGALRWAALLTSLVTFGLAMWVLVLFNKSDPGLQLVVRAPWIQFGGLWNIEYHLALDGISILLVLLTALLTPLALLSTWKSVTERVKEFMIFFLLLEVGMTGVFLAMDLFLFYIFWEFTLVPMYFLIIIWLGLAGGTFSLPDLVARGGIPPNLQVWLFLAFALAFAIKVPMWPLHSWLPDAHVEAPTAGSVILAGVLLK